jgi:chromosome segregation and condensation protein ScpB
MKKDWREKALTKLEKEGLIKFKKQKDGTYRLVVTDKFVKYLDEELKKKPKFVTVKRHKTKKPSIVSWEINR